MQVVLHWERGGKGEMHNARYIGLAFGGGGEGATQMQVNLHFSFKNQPLNYFPPAGEAGGKIINDLSPAGRPPEKSKISSTYYC